ncbi:MAG TPA: YegS/Rv2252/BmrU family lipid kinase [Candidatus Baltobacteraceae bacterium]|jgi:YegS/Rv2252/BmrU family lipid kinase|nr:YegS/Rv2252/BmrU family lipid kinase [Candidatus Baltobacteraceae bacterium]
MRTVTIVCRLSSRNGLSYYQRLAGELPARGVKIAEVHMVRRRKDLRARIRGAVKSGAECVVVIGGDGTQTAAVGELANTNTALAVVPAGTGNSFAFSLGIKDDLDAAIETIVGGRQLHVDIGCVNGTRFANFATVGVIADAANRTPKRLKKIVGPIAYGVAAVGAFFRDKPFEMTVKWKHNRLKIVTHQAIVASGRYFGWQPLTPHANVRSGEIAFFAAAGDKMSDVVETNAALLRGEHTRLAHAHYFSAPKITISTKPKQPVNIDGHALGKTPAKFSVKKRALLVLVPQDFHDLT